MQFAYSNSRILIIIFLLIYANIETYIMQTKTSSSILIDRIIIKMII